VPIVLARITAVQIRNERPEDLPAIREITAAAFAPMPYSSGTEPRIIDALRDAGALTISLVADRRGEVLGHIAFSPVEIAGEPGNWYGLGPVSVAPPCQGLGIGKALIEEGLDRLRALGAGGCVLLGDPGYYGRYGFEHDPALTYADGPPEAFQRLVLQGEAAQGEVRYHAAFAVA
jgi:putative acetyltransferase